ncbi:MAG: hypothetical protein GTO13_00350 [Proteobacteria bacterium]|nr:hypothetical protein [Pseudomonadota bacterium]
MAWKEFAWNGIRFVTPAAWQAGRIGARYLMLEEESGPVLEVKWGRVKGVFSHQAQLGRLAALQGKKLGESVRECPLPAAWEKALAKYQATGFSWHGRTVGGMGVLLYCPTCQNATLIQFYRKDSNQAGKIPQRLLASFRDHRKENEVIWSLFDIRATIPEKFRLVRYRFEAGEFELAFASGGQTITLHRWGPASILLCDRDLIQFARTVLSHPRGEPRPVIGADGKAVEWTVEPPPTLWGHWWGRIKGKSSFQWFRLWHLEEKNRILGVRVEGRRIIEQDLLERICAGYESL